MYLRFIFFQIIAVSTLLVLTSAGYPSFYPGASSYASNNLYSAGIYGYAPALAHGYASVPVLGDGGDYHVSLNL